MKWLFSYPIFSFRSGARAMDPYPLSKQSQKTILGDTAKPQDM